VSARHNIHIDVVKVVYTRSTILHPVRNTSCHKRLRCLDLDSIIEFIHLRFVSVMCQCFLGYAVDGLLGEMELFEDSFRVLSNNSLDGTLQIILLCEEG